MNDANILYYTCFMNCRHIIQTFTANHYHNLLYQWHLQHPKAFHSCTSIHETQILIANFILGNYSQRISLSIICYTLTRIRHKNSKLMMKYRYWSLSFLNFLCALSKLRSPFQRKTFPILSKISKILFEILQKSIRPIRRPFWAFKILSLTY